MFYWIGHSPCTGRPLAKYMINKFINIKIDFFWKKRKKKKKLILTLSVTTVTKLARRGGRKFVQIEGPTITNLNVDVILAALAVSVKAASSSDNSFFYGGMTPLQPPRINSPTAERVYARVSHCISSLSVKSVPAWFQYVVALLQSHCCLGHRSINGVKDDIVWLGAFRGKF